MTKKMAKKLYRKFFGKHPKKEITIDIENFKNVALLGAVERIDYAAIKPKFGDIDVTLYYHHFKNPPMLLTNGKQLLIYGDIKITGGGIEG